MSSELRVDKIVPTTGAPTNGGGGIVQVVQNSDTTTTGTLTMGTANTYYSVPNLNVSITPKSSSSKILISYQSFGEGDEGDWNYTFRIQRAISGGATTNISAPAAGSRAVGMSILPTSFHGNENVSTPTQIAVSNYLDSPATTNAVTYTVQIRCNSANAEWNYNRSGDDNDNVDYDRGMSWITVMEVSA